MAKVLSGSTAATVSLANFQPAGAAQVWQLTSANAISRLSNIAVGGTGVSLTLPAQSVTLLVIPSGGALPTAPNNLRIVGTVSGQ